MKIIIGIDPGLDGAVCILYENGEIDFYDTPTLEIKSGRKKKREYNVNEMANNMRISLPMYPSRDILVVLEKIHSMPGQGVRSMFSMGEGFGIWKGIIAGLNLSLELVTPQAWKKEMMDGSGKDKDASRQKAIQLFPNIADKLSRKKDHGRADALLMAEYIRRKIN